MLKKELRIARRYEAATAKSTHSDHKSAEIFIEVMCLWALNAHVGLPRLLARPRDYVELQFKAFVSNGP